MRTLLALPLIVALTLGGADVRTSGVAAVLDHDARGHVGFDSLLGWTIWECYPTSVPAAFLALRILGTADESIVKAHEADHVAWMLEQRTCEAARDRMKIPAQRLAMEARGFCAGAREGVRVGRYVTLDVAILGASYSLGGYGLGSRREAEAAIRRACGLAPTPTAP